MIPKQVLELISAIRDTKKKLTTVENGFISSCFIAAKHNKLLSQKQSTWLQEIYRKVSGGGQYEKKEQI